MDSPQAKEILALFRPGLDDANDPVFAEALAQARLDPELGRWLDEQHRLDAALRRKFSGIAVPAGLEQQILSERTIVRPVVWWERQVLLAAAAAAVVLALIAGYLLRQPEPLNFATFRKSMALLVSGDYKMMLETKDATEVREFLAKNRGPSDYALGKEMEKLPLEGCALVKWHGQRISLVCLDHGEAPDLFLFVMDRGAIPDPPVGQAPQMIRVGHMMTASWCAGHNVYVLASKTTEDELRKFL